MVSYSNLMVRYCLLFFSVLVWSFTAKAQEKILAGDYGYTTNVQKAEEIKYEYNSKEGLYKIIKQRTLEFTNGKLKKLVEGEMQLNEFEETIITYTYNQKGQIWYSTEQALGKETDTFYFVYNNQRLYSKTGGNPKVEEIYEYNDSGFPTKITTRYVGGNMIRQIEYSGYQGAKTYKLSEKNYFKGTVTKTSENEVVNGKVIASSLKYSFADKAIKTYYKYDDHGNSIEESSEAGLYKNVFTYDLKGNVIQVKFGGAEKNGQIFSANEFLFTRISYTDGSVTGNTDLAEVFVKKYDIKSGSYKFETRLASIAATLKVAIESLEDEELVYNVMKLKEDKCRVELNDEDITKGMLTLKAPNGLDLVLYDDIWESSLIVKDYYTALVPVNKWVTATYLPVSSSNTYYVLTNKGKSVNIISEGVYLFLKEYTLVNSPSGKDIEIKKNGKVLYILKDCYSKPDNIFYAVEIPKSTN